MEKKITKSNAKVISILKDKKTLSTKKLVDELGINHPSKVREIKELGNILSVLIKNKIISSNEGVFVGISPKIDATNDEQYYVFDRVILKYLDAPLSL